MHKTRYCSAHVLQTPSLMKHVLISKEASKMQTKKLNFGIAYASLALATGFIATPAMLGSAIAGPSDMNRKVMINMDPDVALLLGFKIDSIEPAAANSALIAHSELKANYAGVTLEGHVDLMSIFDPENIDNSITSEVSGISTVVFILSKASALKHELIADSDGYSDDTIFLIAQGISADIVIDQVDIAVSTPISRKLVAGYFASEIFDADPAAVDGTSSVLSALNGTGAHAD